MAWLNVWNDDTAPTLRERFETIIDTADGPDPVEQADPEERLEAVYDAVTDDAIDQGPMEQIRERYADGGLHQTTRSELRGQVREMMADAYAAEDSLEIHAARQAASTLLAQETCYPTKEELAERRDPAADIEAYLRETAVVTSDPVEDPERTYTRLRGSLASDYAEPGAMLDEIAYVGLTGEVREEESSLSRLTSVVGL